MAFVFKKLEIPEVILVQPNLYEDNRGFFMETYKYSEFAKNGMDKQFVQDSHSYSVKNVIRGLHYQNYPKGVDVLVRCIRGEIFDVAVDIRPESPTFGKWVSAILSKENRNQLYIPCNFAHGFCVLSDEAEVVYKQTNEYTPEYERSIIWNDSTINISWPISFPIISAKDAENPKLLNENE